ncbi:MAG: hypothetical protein QOC93_2673 [Actinomycetota bacterium]|jgi:elongation factor P hydroxylase|nr:hypothetical protein [Actinomycetota bacterium]
MPFRYRFVSCDDCGASVERTTADGHRCEPERLAAFVLFGLRERVAAFERDLAEYLETPHGRFAAWEAARQVRRPRG